MSVAARSAPSNKYPATTFLAEARQRFIDLGLIAYDGGSRSPNTKDTRATGYLSRIRAVCRLSGSVGVANTASADAFGALAGPVDRVQLRTLTVSNIIDLSGEMAAVMTFLDNWYRQPGTSLNPAGAYSFTATPAIGAFAGEWTFDLPVSVELANYPSPLGLYQTAVAGQVATVAVNWRPVVATVGVPGSGIYVPGASGTYTGVTGNARLQQEYFEPIQNPNGWPVGDYMHRWREFSVPVNGDNTYEIPLVQGNYYSRLIYLVVTNGAVNATAVNRLQYEFGGNMIPMDETGDSALTRQARMWNGQIPAGFYIHDFLTPNHTDRDFVNSAVVTAPRAAFTLSGASYGGAANYIRTAVEEFIPLRNLAALLAA
jgi:hypothetical protein